MNGTAHSERNATIQTNLTEKTDKKKIRHEVQTDSETDRTERRGCKTDKQKKTDKKKIRHEMQTDSETDRTYRMGRKTDKQKELVRGWLGVTRQGPEI